MSNMWIFTAQVDLDVTADGEVAITSGGDGRMRLWELATGQYLGAFYAASRKDECARAHRRQDPCLRDPSASPR
jgi:hypothetical protein